MSGHWTNFFNSNEFKEYQEVSNKFAIRYPNFTRRHRANSTTTTSDDELNRRRRRFAAGYRCCSRPLLIGLLVLGILILAMLVALVTVNVINSKGAQDALENSKMTTFRPAQNTSTTEIKITPMSTEQTTPDFTKETGSGIEP